MLKQSCIQFGYEKSLCDVISENNKNTTKIEEELQPYVAKIKVVITILNSSVPAVLQLFLGSWSDKNGRKKVINSAALGFVLTHTSITAVCYYSENILPLPAWIFIICYIPVNFLGGFSSIMITTFCYITDICEKPNRPYHFTLVELMMVTSIFFGAILCSFILSMSNVIFVFTTATICTLLGAIIVIIFVDESIQIVQNSSSSLKSILSTKHIIKMIRTCFKSRKLYGRSILLSLILIMTLNRFVSDEEKIIGYLYERMVFNWTLEDHNNYQAVRIIVKVLGTIFAMSVLKKLFGFSDIILICLAIFLNFIDNVFIAFASQTWHMYAISLISCIKMIIHPLCRSIISSTVSKNEMGKVMSFTSSIESLANVIAPTILIAIYEATYITFPGALFLVCAAICFMNLFIVFYVMIVRRIVQNIKEKYTEIY